MDRAELIAKSWKNEFTWSQNVSRIDGHLEAIARRVLAAVEQAEPTDAALNTAVLICCGVEEKDADEDAKVPPEKTPSRATKTSGLP